MRAAPASISRQPADRDDQKNEQHRPVRLNKK